MREPLAGEMDREFVNGEEEKFLTTHHERDQESDLDYRGARFLSLDPLAHVDADWTAYRYAKDNPMFFVDPNGLYEWRVNSATGTKEKIGDRGGDTEQYIYWDNAKEPSAKLKGKTLYTGYVATDWYKDGVIAVAVGTTDYWENLPDFYQGSYTISDLQERYKAKKSGGLKYKTIREQEAEGLPRREMIWNLFDVHRYLDSQGVTNRSGFIIAVHAEFIDVLIPGGSGSQLGKKVFESIKNLKSVKGVKPPNKFNFNMPTTGNRYSKNSWIRFLQKSKGKYKGRGYGKSWIREAAMDYKELKRLGKL